MYDQARGKGYPFHLLSVSHHQARLAPPTHELTTLRQALTTPYPTLRDPEGEYSVGSPTYPLKFTPTLFSTALLWFSVKRNSRAVQLTQMHMSYFPKKERGATTQLDEPTMRSRVDEGAIALIAFLSNKWPRASTNYRSARLDAMPSLHARSHEVRNRAHSHAPTTDTTR